VGVYSTAVLGSGCWVLGATGGAGLSVLDGSDVLVPRR